MSTTTNIDPESFNSTVENVLTGTQTKTSERAQHIHSALRDGYNLPTKLTKDGVLIDVSRAKRAARDKDADEYREEYGHPSPFLASAIAGSEYERGAHAAVDAVMERAATPDGERAGPIDASVVQAASPIEVDPAIVDIQVSAAPLLDLVTFEAQAGFTAQYNIISDRSRPIGNVSESDAIDLSDNDKGDFTLDTKTRDMGIYIDQIELSDFTQRAEDTLGYMDVEETTLGQRVTTHARFTAGELLYGDPDVGLSDGSIQDSTATPGLARIAQDADTNSVGGADNVKDKSGESGGFLEDLKSEITSLVSNTGAAYDDLVAVTSPTFFDAIENEANTVVRLGGYDEDINFGNRQITIKQNVPLREVRAVGRSEHGQISYDGTGSGGNFDPDPGDVFIYDQSAFRRRQLAPLSTVPLGRVGLADKAAMFEYKANIDKSHGAHTKYLQAYAF